MPSLNRKSVSIDEKTFRQIKKLSEREGISPSELTKAAIKEYRRKIFFRNVNSEVHQLKEDSPELWKEYLKEREELEGTLEDGIQ